MIDEERRQMKVRFRHLLQREVQGRHDRSDRDPIDRFEIKFGKREKIPRVHTPLINGSRARGSQPPMRRQRLAFKDSERGVGVTNVDYQQHRQFEFNTLSISSAATRAPFSSLTVSPTLSADAA